MSKITELSNRPKKNKSKWFFNKYSREMREINTLSPDNISDELKNYYLPPSENTIYAITEEHPFNGFNYFKELNLNDSIVYSNPLLIYRLLKDMYGLPDVVGCFLTKSESDKSKITLGDWSFILRINNYFVAEIRSMFINTKHIIRIWTDESDIGEKEYNILKIFLKDIDKIVEENLDFFNEKDELKKSIHSTFHNSFAVKYKSAERLFEIANSIDVRPEKKQLEWNENPEVHTAGSIYMSSVLFYIISLETFLNILYEIFLHEDYKRYPYERVTSKADLQIRLSTIHLFCTCFESRVIFLESNIWKDVEKLRAFRNDIVHGNITDEQYIHCLVEDSLFFYYSPNTDFRGRKEENNGKKMIPRVMWSININEASEVRNIVNNLIQTIINAMDGKSKTWVEGWLYDLAIPIQKF